MSTCPISIFSNPSVNYDEKLNYNNTSEKCMAIGFDNTLISKSSIPYEIKEISCNNIKPNSKLIVYTYKNASNDVIPCPLGGWCNNTENQNLLNLGINNNEINKDFNLYTIDGTTKRNISDLCRENVSIQLPTPTPTPTPIPTPESQVPLPIPTPESQVPIPVQNNCTLNYFNTSNASLNCDTVNIQNNFTSDLCRFRPPENIDEFYICKDTEKDLELVTPQNLDLITCPNNTIIQTYKLSIMSEKQELYCPIGEFCTDATNRNNLKNYIRGIITDDPRCIISGQSTDQQVVPPINQPINQPEQPVIPPINQPEQQDIPPINQPEYPTTVELPDQSTN
jgi:hypothetical protein